MKKPVAPKTTVKKRISQKNKQKPEEKDFLIVGIGASAGGVQALKIFFENVPADSGAAYVVILHLSPDHDSLLTEVLQTVANIPVTQVGKKVQVRPDHIYVISPNESLSMSGGHLVVSPIHTIEERRAPVDIFFRTLAESHHARAVAVILSGTGANGSMGLKRVKENGGAAFVQNPREAEFSEMPRNSIATELVDEVLNVADIPAKIIAYRQNLGKIVIPVEPESRLEEQQQALREIFTQLRIRMGHDFTNYKRPTVLRRIERRINVRNLPDLPAYAAYLKENPDEVQLLLKDLLISVTNFFRDKEAFNYLETEILPKIFEGKTAGDQIRLWVAGCATGEEAYSLAMMLAEKNAAMPDAPAIQIFATDLDEDAIATARNGFYTLNDAADVSPERLRRFFTKENDGFRIRRELREMILFARHNLLKDPPFSQLDLVTCRNLLIYFNRTAQERVMETFHFALKPDSYLFLGSSESIDGASDLYTPLNREYRLYQSRQGAPRISYPVPDLSPSLRYAQPYPAVAIQEKDYELQEKFSYGELHRQILEQYAPPSLIVNEHYDVVHVSELAGRYLQIAGELSKNLFKLIRPDLRLDLSTAVYQAVQDQTNVKAEKIKVRIDERLESVDISVRPVLRQTADAMQGFILIFFEHGADMSEAGEAVFSPPEPTARRLEEELIRSQTQYRSSVERAEIQAEELKASNEELQAINEELRSATEELETGKEELQSVNEELVTVNQELKIKIEELSQSNTDFQNLINSTMIGTIFLDRNLRVKMFTPTATEIFNLIPADIGRSLSDITNNLEYRDLLTDVELSLNKLQFIEREVHTFNGSSYMMQITPYRTLEDYISGTIITFVNITAKTEQRVELLKLNSQLKQQSLIFNATLSGITDFAYIFDREGRFIYSNRPLLELLGITLEDITGKNFFDLNYPEDLAARLQAQIRQVFETGEIVKDDTPFTAPNGSSGFYEYIFSPVREVDGSVGFVAGSTRDVTTRKRSEANSAFLAEISKELTSLTGIDQIMRTVGTKIGAYLRLSACSFVEVDEAAEVGVINYAWSRPDVPGIVGVYPFKDFLTGEFQKAGQSGEPFIVSNTQTDSRADAAGYAALKIGSFLSVPLLKNGQWRFLLVAYHSEPHDWQPDEIELIDDLTKRVWTRLESASADEALRESEEKYRSLFDSIDEGFCVIEMIFDEQGRAVDYRFLETNLKFEKQSGVVGAAGKTISEVVPEIEAQWLEIYGGVAVTGQPARFENYTAPLDSWFECYAFPTGVPGQNRVAVLFKDVTDRVRRETNLVFLADLSQNLLAVNLESEIMKILGGHLSSLTNASMCGFFEIDEAKNECVCSYDWHRTDGPALTGTYDIREFMTAEFQAMMSAGQTVAVRDVAQDSRVSNPDKFKALKIGAFVNVPIIREGKWRNSLGVYHEDPYDWHEEELIMLQEAADRLWVKMERTRADEALRESEEHLRIAVEAAEMGTWSWELASGDIYWNERHFTLFGMEPRKEPVRVEDFFSHVYEEDRAWVGARLKKAVETNTVFEAEFRARLETGELRWMEGYGQAVEMIDGRTTRMSGVMSDITDRRRTLEIVSSSEERLRLIISSVEDYFIITTDPEGIITGWNPGAKKVFGYDEQEVIGRPADIIFTPEDIQKGAPQKEMLTALKKGRAEDERWHIRRDGSRFYASGVMQPLKDGKASGFVKIARDMTERISVEQIRRDKEMLQKLVGAQEDERKRIARDLHDELGQLLTALRLKLETARKKCDEDEVCSQIDDAQQLAKQLDSGIDFLAWELRPAALDDLGLRAALAKYVREWSHFAGITAELLDSDFKQARLMPEVETNLYRIAQEALNNVHKHAKAKRVEIVLEKRGRDLVVLIIEDDGKGFNPKSKMNRNKGIGLIGMQERAALIGGTLEIESARGNGTTVFVRVPVEPFKKEKLKNE